MIFTVNCKLRNGIRSAPLTRIIFYVLFFFYFFRLCHVDMDFTSATIGLEGISPGPQQVIFTSRQAARDSLLQPFKKKKKIDGRIPVLRLAAEPGRRLFNIRTGNDSRNYTAELE